MLLAVLGFYLNKMKVNIDIIEKNINKNQYNKIEQNDSILLNNEVEKANIIKQTELDQPIEKDDLKDQDELILVNENNDLIEKEKVDEVQDEKIEVINDEQVDVKKTSMVNNGFKINIIESTTPKSKIFFKDENKENDIDFEKIKKDFKVNK